MPDKNATIQKLTDNNIYEGGATNNNDISYINEAEIHACRAASSSTHSQG